MRGVGADGGDATALSNLEANGFDYASAALPRP